MHLSNVHPPVVPSASRLARGVVLLGATSLALGLTVGLASCASYTHIPQGVRTALSARHTGRTVELKQSCYFGDLYDENEKWLLSPYPFAETFHIVDTEGAPIHPQGQRGILPAGTTFVVQQVEFPDGAAMTRRMFTTPRYNTWVYLSPAEGSAAQLQDRRSFIMILPLGIDTEQQVEDAIGRVLAPQGETSKWLATLRPTVRVAIENKDIVVGMTQDELTASQGEPQRWFNETDATGKARVAWYPSKEAWLRNDTVAEIKPGRAAEAVGQH